MYVTLWTRLDWKKKEDQFSFSLFFNVVVPDFSDFFNVVNRIVSEWQKKGGGGGGKRRSLNAGSCDNRTGEFAEVGEEKTASRAVSCGTHRDTIENGYEKEKPQKDEERLESIRFNVLFVLVTCCALIRLLHDGNGAAPPPPPFITGELLMAGVMTTVTGNFERH